MSLQMSRFSELVPSTKPRRMVPVLFWPLGGMLDVSHVTVCVEPVYQVVPALGDVTGGATTMSSLRLVAGVGDAVVDAARTRAERRVVRSCIAKGGEDG
jgi:hypothetical protein